MHKKISLSNDLIYINLISWILAAIIFLSNFEGGSSIGVLRIILGLPFVLFFPGYTLIAALFPGRGDIEGIERVALSFGLSIAVVPLLGLGLNYTPWGIRLAPILITLLVFIAGTSALALYRRNKLPVELRFYPAFEFNLPLLRELSRIDKVLSVFLAAAIVFALGSVFYVVTTPKAGEKFTEFYILGTDGKAQGYPQELAVNEKGRVIAGIVNHEYSSQKYYVKVVMGKFLKKQLGPIELAHEERREETVDFSAVSPNENLKVEFLLYREGDQKPYRSLHLWVKVHKEK